VRREGRLSNPADLRSERPVSAEPHPQADADDRSGLQHLARHKGEDRRDHRSAGKGFAGIFRVRRDRSASEAAPTATAAALIRLRLTPALQGLRLASELVCSGRSAPPQSGRPQSDQFELLPHSLPQFRSGHIVHVIGEPNRQRRWSGPPRGRLLFAVSAPGLRSYSRICERSMLLACSGTNPF
jgi:hypothetical protein